MVSGCLIAVVATILTWMFAMGGVLHGTFTREPVTDRIRDAGDLNLVPLTILFMAVGILMVFGGVGYGLWRNSKDRVGVRRVEPYLRVLARYAYDKGQLITTDWDIESADKPRFYIRVMYQNETVEELETSLEVYYQCGEGMYGEGEIQGRWLGRFTPYIGTPPST